MTRTRAVRKPQLKYVAGLDLSLTATGLVVMDSFGKVVLRRVIKSKLTGPARLNEIQHTIRSLLSTFPIGLVCIEDYATGATNGKTFHIGELGGVVRLLLYRIGMNYLEPKPTQLKKFATGAGIGSKDQITMHVYKNWSFEAIDNNEADAYVLARIAMGIIGVYPDMKKHQKEVVHQILNPPEKTTKKKKGE